MKAVLQASQVQIVDFPKTSVAVLAHRGDPSLLGRSIRTSIEWRKQNRLPPAASATFNIFYDDPEVTEPDEFRIDLCAATSRRVTDNPCKVIGHSRGPMRRPATHRFR